ncbi:MAG: tetratricopeptide repeat protein, partial [Vicinamibacteria bacterium]
MSKKRRRKSSSSVAPPAKRVPRGRGLAAIAVLAAGAGAVVFFLGRETAPPVPEIDISAMEPAVSEKILEHRQKVESDPRSADAWGELGMVLQAHGLDPEASEAYRRAIELDPRSFRWHYLRAHALRGSDAAVALSTAEQALAIDPGYAAAHVLQAEIFEGQGESEKALAHYEKALEIQPSSAIASFGAGRLHLASGDIEGARALLEAAVALDPQAGAIHASLAQLYRRLGEAENAREEAELAFERKEAVGIVDPVHFAMRQESVSSLMQLDRAVAAAEAGDLEAAAAIYRSLVELRPDDADMRSRYGDVLAQSNDVARAKEQYRAALDTNPEHASAHHGMGNLLNLEGDFEAALTHY